ncbi:hypothetical protein BHE74_00025915 [Ensete ventricosum]|nr:hypothetical protein BHE74_00025915 [Ensete ventricosum]
MIANFKDHFPFIIAKSTSLCQALNWSTSAPKVEGRDPCLGPWKGGPRVYDPTAAWGRRQGGIDGRPWCQPSRAYIGEKRRGRSRFCVPSFVGRKGAAVARRVRSFVPADEDLFSRPIAARQWQKGPPPPTTFGTVSGPRRTPRTLNYMYNFAAKGNKGTKEKVGFLIDFCRLGFVIPLTHREIVVDESMDYRLYKFAIASE